MKLAVLAPFAVVAAATAVTGSADAAALRLTRLGLADFSADTGDIAWIRAGVLRVRTAAGRSRSYSATSYEVDALARTMVALHCNRPTVGATIMLLDRASGRMRPVQSPPTMGTPRISAIGARWGLVDTSLSIDGAHSQVQRHLLNLQTGQAIDLSSSDPFGGHRYLDLNTQDPARPLCQPLTRSTDSRGDPLLRRRSMTRSGRWFLEQDTGGFADLQRCASRAKRRFSTHEGLGPVLGDGFVGYLLAGPHPRIVMQGLTNKRRGTAPWQDATTPVLAATGRRLIISARAPNRPFTVYSAAGLGLSSSAVGRAATDTPASASSPCHIGMRDVRIDTQGSNGTARIDAIVRVKSRHQSCRLIRRLSLSVSQGGRDSHIDGNPTRRTVHLTLGRDAHAEFVVSWANWCGARSRASYAVLRAGPVRRRARISVLPTCLNRAHRSSLDVVSIGAQTNDPTAPEGHGLLESVLADHRIVRAARRLRDLGVGRVAEERFAGDVANLGDLLGDSDP